MSRHHGALIIRVPPHTNLPLPSAINVLNATPPPVAPRPHHHYLRAAILNAQPSSIYIILPPTPYAQIPPSQLPNLTHAALAVRPPSVSSATVHLLIDGFLSSQAVSHYLALFVARHVYQGPSAALLLSSLANAPTWSGFLSVSTTHPSPPILPGLTLTADTPISPHLQGPAYIIAARTHLPPQPLFQTARSSYTLAISSSATSATTSFINQWYSTRVSLLLRLSHIHLWCFWRTTPSTLTCTALYIPPLPPSITRALDCATFRRQALSSVARTPILHVPSPVSVLTTFRPRNSQHHLTPPISPLSTFSEAVSLLARRSITNQNPSHPSRVPVAHPSSSNNLLCTADISILERRFLAATTSTRVCNPPQLPHQSSKSLVLSSRNAAQPATSTDPASRSHTSRAEEELASEMALRKVRFARLQKLRGRSTSSDALERRRSSSSIVLPVNKNPRSNRQIKSRNMAPAGAVYITQAIRGALKTLEQSDDFFNFHSAQRDMGVRHACAPDRTWLAVGERLSDCRRDGTLRNLRESTAERMVHQGAHGVEFAEDGDVRDRQLATYEMLVGKSSIEYAHAKYLSKSHMSKLNDSVEQLRLLAATCNTSLHQPPQLTTTTPNIHAYTNSDCNNSQFDCSSSAVPMDEWHESMVKKTIQAVRNGQMSQQMKAMLLASLEISPT